MEIGQYINEKNRKIWNELSSIYQIEILYNPKESSWRIDTEDSVCKKIITPTKRLEIDSFTHELLHLYIDNLGMSTPNEILHSMYGERSFNVLTKKGLFAIIHNFCSHKKMFPYYVEMGFSEERFVSKPAKIGFISYLIIKMQLKNKLFDQLKLYLSLAMRK